MKTITLPTLWLTLFCLTGTGVARAAALPEGNAPPALEFRHFPDRLHAFVWRNWNAVPAERMAAVVGTSAANVAAIAESMGLPPERPVPAAMRERGYITLVRRNWHLLPYDQLLVLLDMDAERFAHLLREDDFLFVKLGNHKPRCERLAYADPSPAARARAARIRQVVEEQVGPELRQPEEPRFGFLSRFNAPATPPPAPPAAAALPYVSLRYIYSYAAVYGDPLSSPEVDPYPDGLLKQLSDLGVNGVWLHVVLRQLAPGGPTFPEFGAGHERRLEALRALVARAKRFGVNIYLYLNEPRAMPVEFFKGRPGMAGAREGDFAAMCTSDPAVRAWVTDSLAHVFRAVPGLGGVFTITASENLTSCASHFGHKNCPRCAGRGGAEVVAELNTAIEAGVRAGSPDARVIVWDWGWPDDWAEPVIARLPKNAWMMSVSEWSLPLSRGGVNATVGEYSMSAVGPGPRAARHWALAEKAGLRRVAKVQLNNTWELSAVPYLPVLDLVADHCAKLRAAGVDDLMLSWSLGGYPSPNLEIARRMSARPASTNDAVLDATALDRYGPAGAAHARRAWTLFSAAFVEYPYDAGVIYTCPVQFGPANLLYPTHTGYPATMVGFPYDDLTRWRGPYPVDVFLKQFEHLSEGWARGVAALEQATAQAPPARSRDAADDLLIARAAGLHFRSVANQVRFVRARDALVSAPPLAAPERWAAREILARTVRDELAAACELLALTRRDSRIGFEASNHYFYLPQDLVEKIVNCQDLLDAHDVTRP